MLGGLDRVAARNAQLEHLRVIEGVPRVLLGDRELAAGLHVHGSGFL